MNLEFFFNALAAVWTVGEILIALITTTGRGQGRKRHRETQIILWIVVFASLNIVWWMHNLFPVDMPGSYSWLRPVALGILILGLGVRAAAVVMLGRD
jgi:hypothetical protein